MADTFKIPTTVLRFFNVYGPRQSVGHIYAAVVPAFIEAALSNKPLLIHGDGNQRRDFTYVDTVTQVLVRTIEERVTSDGPLNLASGQTSSLLDLVNTLEDILDKPLKVEHTPPRRGDITKSWANGRRFSGLFPNTDFYDLQYGLARTIDWYRSKEKNEICC